MMMVVTSMVAAALLTPSLRRFPANMLLWKTTCDLVTSAIVVGSLIADGVARTGSLFSKFNHSNFSALNKIAVLVKCKAI